MKVLVIGANGQVGKHLVAKIQDTGDIKAKAMIRKEEQVPYFEDLGAETVLTDLEKADIDEIAKAVEGTDAIVFTAGSGPKTGADKTMLIDLDAAVKTIEAAKKAGVKRYIMVSSFDTTREAIQSAPSSFAPYVVAKHYADVWLRATDLDYTIVHPGGLTNDAATGKVQAAENVGRGEIPREDVASVLLATLQNDSTIGKEFQVVSGETAVDDAVKVL
ncbi:SDR family oxidoreductase [Jeotgalibacillus aurantiacus]|uniref:SDR family oxidoreductase n=1 Tax=Jeotgalibacillus aurantiacus TaxID=2763266 RepID=UPI001D0AD71E|nr:SDR family oxidoreductase [Jeotgalibacillus aurantiacus]